MALAALFTSTALTMTTSACEVPPAGAVLVKAHGEASDAPGWRTALTLGPHTDVVVPLMKSVAPVIFTATGD